MTYITPCFSRVGNVFYSLWSIFLYFMSLLFCTDDYNLNQMQHLNATHTLVGLLTSDTYRLLQLLSKLQVGTVDGERVRESQEEIAELFHVSKGKLNPLMQALVAVGCIQKYRARSGYVVTPLGTQVIDYIDQLNAMEQEQQQSKLA